VDLGTAARLEHLLGVAIDSAQPLGGQHGVAHFRLITGDGRTAFAKVGPPGAGHEGGAGFAAEASGLRWLADAGMVPVPAVLGWDDGLLVMDWIDVTATSRDDAARFGENLSRLHAAGADGFGAPWAGSIAGLPLPNRAPEAGTGWAEWYAAARVLPYVRLARDAGSLTAADAALIEAAAAHAPAVTGPAEPPARIHGDCWSGNVLWSGGQGWLVDPAAHGGHRETDLAMLALFGAPYLDRILAGYQEAAPLAEGWQDRVPLHQLHPLLVHVCLFGGGYVAGTLAAARAVLGH
jgi:fructosamine-3-kinase